MNQIKKLKDCLKKATCIVEDIDENEDPQSYIRGILRGMSLEELAKMSLFITSLMVKPMRKRSFVNRTPKDKINEIVNSYIRGTSPDLSLVVRYRDIEAKRDKDRTPEERKFFISFRKWARDWHGR